MGQNQVSSTKGLCVYTLEAVICLLLSISFHISAFSNQTIP